MIITRRSLRRWAEGQNQGNNVGVSHRVDSCPIATYIHDKGGDDPYVGDTQIRWTDPKTGSRIMRPLTDELKSVIHKVDNWCRGPVSREDFLDVLDSVDRHFGR